VPVLEEHQDDRGLGRAWTSIAYVEGAYHSYRRREEAAARNALLHYKRARWPFSIPLGEIASALFFGPTPVQEAIPACTALLEEADLNGQANVVAYLGGLEAMNGDFEQARKRMTEARQTFSELGQAFGAEITCGAMEGEIEILAEDLRTARRALESSCLALEQRGEQRYLATRSAALAEVLYQQGEFEEAARRNRVAQSGSTIDDVATEWRWRTVEAKLTAYEGDFAGAERLARAAYELLADTDALNHQAACLVSLGEVLSLADRPSEAVIAFERASELFEQKGNVVAARKTRPMTESP
jgi:tetratricopeptide (TPR) repeat protein